MLKEKLADQFDFLKAKTPPLIGCDISSSSVKMVEIAEAGRNVYRVERYAIEPLPKDTVVDGNIANIEAAGEAIKRAHKNLGSRIKNVAMALPAAAVITKKVILPGNQREEEMEGNVQSEANQYIPFSLDEVNLDFQVLGPAPSGDDEVEVLIAASRKEKIEDRVAAAEAAGLKTIVMDVESYASQCAFELICEGSSGVKESDVTVIVDIGATVTFWPIDNRTEEGVLEKIEKGVHFIRTPSGALVEAHPTGPAEAGGPTAGLLGRAGDRELVEAGGDPREATGEDHPDLEGDRQAEHVAGAGPHLVVDRRPTPLSGRELEIDPERRERSGVEGPPDPEPAGLLPLEGLLRVVEAHAVLAGGHGDPPVAEVVVADGGGAQ